MRQTLWTLATLLSHWRRHPANLATLLVGLAIATALWSGVQALNEHARKSYASAAAAVSGADARALVSTRGGLFAQDLYIKLRLAGWKVSPVLEGTVRVGEKSLRVIGVEPLTLPRGARLASLREGEGIADFLKPPGLSFAAPETLAEIGEGAKTERGLSLPPLRALDAAPAGALIVDIGVAQILLDRPERLSRLMLEAKGARPLASVVGDALRLVEPDEDSDLERLTGSFHLNLTAFGLLSFLVGLFIVHASFGLAFEQRLPTIRTLRAVGVSSRALIAAMAFELLALALLAGGAGVALGYVIARALLPNVAASLDSLYGAQLPERLTLDAGWALSGLAMALLGASSAAAGGLIRTFRLPVLSVGAAPGLARGASALFAATGAGRGARLRGRRRRAVLGRRTGRRLRADRRRIARRRLGAAGRAGRRSRARRAPRQRPGDALVLGRQPPAASRPVARLDGLAAGAVDQYRRRRDGRGFSRDLHALAGRPADRRGLFRGERRRRRPAHRGMAGEAAGSGGDSAGVSNQDANRALAGGSRVA